MDSARDGLATMLLTMALSPDREEYARPLGTQEFAHLTRRVQEAGLEGVGQLPGLEISRLMELLEIPEEEAYRLYTLMNRSVQLNYALENLLIRGIEVVTIYSEGYPKRVSERLGPARPPFCYMSGNSSLADAPAVAVMGIRGVRTTPELRDGIVHIVRAAVREGYSVITGGELGVSRVASDAMREAGGTLIDVLGGNMGEHIGSSAAAELLASDRALVLSAEHPDALLTVPHAAARNRMIFALADAAFICNTDGRRGEAEAVGSGLCKWVYAWSGCVENRPLISRGAVPVPDLRSFDFTEAVRRWRESASEQISIFELL